MHWMSTILQLKKEKGKKKTSRQAQEPKKKKKKRVKGQEATDHVEGHEVDLLVEIKTKPNKQMIRYPTYNSYSR